MIASNLTQGKSQMVEVSGDESAEASADGPGGGSADGSTDELIAEDAHHILSNTRRRLTITFLQEADGESLTVRALSEEIAQVETDEDPPPRDVRKSVYTTLLQNHLPMLDTHGIVEYDDDRKEVTLRDRADQVTVYMEVVTENELSWAEFYVGLGLLGVLSMVAVQVGVPGIASLGTALVAGTLFGLVALAGVVHTYSQEQIAFNRFFDRE